MCIDDIVEEDEALWRLEDKVKVDCYDHMLITRELPTPMPIKATDGAKQAIPGKYFRYETVLVPIHYGVLDNAHEDIMEWHEHQINARYAHKSYLEHIKKGGALYK